jgi:hypothetical protein
MTTYPFVDKQASRLGIGLATRLWRILSFYFLRLGFGLLGKFTLGMGVKESIIEAYNIIGAQSGWLAAYNCM